MLLHIHEYEIVLAIYDINRSNMKLCKNSIYGLMLLFMVHFYCLLIIFKTPNV